MPSDSFVVSLDWHSLGKEPAEKQSECTFWTGQNGQMCVQYFRPKTDVFYHPHTHSEYTIAVCLSGEVMIQQLGGEQTIGPGEVLIGNQGIEHSSAYRTRGGKSCEAVNVTIDRRFLAGMTNDLGLPPADGETCPAFLGKVGGTVLLDCARDIAHELRTQRPGHKIAIQAQAIRLVVETLRSWPRGGIQEIKADSLPRLPRRDFVRAYEFMRWCRKESFRLEHLCRFLGSSEERFTRLFLASTQQTPASFYNRMLLDRACDLLHNPKLSVKEVGFELGFKTSSHFIAAFRREHAVSPQEYRRQRKPVPTCYNSVKTAIRNSVAAANDAGNAIPSFLE